MRLETHHRQAECLENMRKPRHQIQSKRGGGGTVAQCINHKIESTAFRTNYADRCPSSRGSAMIMSPVNAVVVLPIPWCAAADHKDVPPLHVYLAIEVDHRSPQSFGFYIHGLYLTLDSIGRDERRLRRSTLPILVDSLTAEQIRNLIHDTGTQRSSTSQISISTDNRLTAWWEVAMHVTL